MRFWIEEYAFGEGETTILREQIKVCCFRQCQMRRADEGKIQLPRAACELGIVAGLRQSGRNFRRDLDQVPINKGVLCSQAMGCVLGQPSGVS